MCLRWLRGNLRVGVRLPVLSDSKKNEDRVFVHKSSRLLVADESGRKRQGLRCRRSFGLILECSSSALG